MAEQSDSFRPRKRLGQHFLIDPNVIRKIVAEVVAEDDAQVVEIGPGRGALTGELLARYPEMIAIEVDPRSVAFLRDKYPGLALREMDVLSVDWKEVAGDPPKPLVVVGNLPYNITSQILFGLIESHAVRRAVLTMQKEVAERLVAKPRTKEYGILSVTVQLITRPEIRFNLTPNVFYPKPEVWSSTVRLEWPDQGSAIPFDEYEYLRKVVRTAFNQRRKMLRNSLSPLVAGSDREIPDWVETRRAEELTPAEFLRLAAELSGRRR